MGPSLTCYRFVLDVQPDVGNIHTYLYGKLRLLSDAGVWDSRPNT
jgi:hypothetical protein